MLAVIYEKSSIYASPKTAKFGNLKSETQAAQKALPEWIFSLISFNSELKIKDYTSTVNKTLQILIHKNTKF